MQRIELRAEVPTQHAEHIHHGRAEPRAVRLVRARAAEQEEAPAAGGAVAIRRLQALEGRGKVDEHLRMRALGLPSDSCTMATELLTLAWAWAFVLALAIECVLLMALAFVFIMS